MSAAQPAEQDRERREKRRRRRVRVPRTRPRRLWRGILSTSITAVAAVAVVVLAFNPPWQAQASSAPSLSPIVPDPTGTITAPDEGTRVRDAIPVSGTLHNVPTGSTAWLIAEVVGPDGNPSWEQLRPALTDRLWPSPEPLASQESWETALPLPPIDVDGLWLRISLVVADEGVHAAFREYSLTAERARHPGISPVPATGLIRLADVVVVLDVPPVIL